MRLLNRFGELVNGSSRRRESHRAQPCLRLFGQTGEHHGHVIARMFAAGAGNHHARTMNPPALGWRMQGDRHFRPRGERCRAAKLNSVFVDDDGIGRKR